MSFASEPYGVFVDDLLSGLTGGVVREEFTFIDEQKPFRLGFGADVVATTVRIHGIANGAFLRFTPDKDYEILDDGTIEWLDGADASPDRGSRFYASYERAPDPQDLPRLTDRNPGSVVRLLAESFGREYAVMSRQLELVYEGAFLETASGRDLDAVVALLGVERRARAIASGEVVFARSTPAPADIFIPPGTLISTGEAPAVTVETADERTLRSGTLSVAVPVRSTVPGPAGVAGAGTLTVIHRPILGVEAVANPQAMVFGGTEETDESLRRRSARALEAGGRSTIGALIGALTSVEGIREQDVSIVEDHLAFPGVVKVTVAATLPDTAAARAAALIEEARPAGIRVLHNLPLIPASELVLADDDNGQAFGPPPAPQVVLGTRFPIGVAAVVTPAAATLTEAQKHALIQAVEDAVEGFADRLGVGETVVYNRLVATIMGLDGVDDVSVDLYAPPAPPAGRHNLAPSPLDTRPLLVANDVTLRGALIAIDVVADVKRAPLAATDAAQFLADARGGIAQRLADHLATHPASITAESLKGAVTDTDSYVVTKITYTTEFLDEGLRISAEDVKIVASADQQPWLRAVRTREAGAP